MNPPSKPQTPLQDRQDPEPSAEDAAWDRYLESLDADALAAMKRPARGDVEARLRAHIQRLEALQARAS